MKKLIPMMVIALFLVGCDGLSWLMSDKRVTRFKTYTSTVITYHAPAMPNGSQEITGPETAVNIDDFMLEIKALDINGSEVVVSQPVRFGLFSQAHAATPLPTFEESSIYSLTIISDADFSPEYLKGSDLSSLFKIEFLRTGRGEHYFGQNDFIQNLYGMGLDAYLDGQNYMLFFMQLKLTEAPTLAKVHKFKVIVDDYKVIDPVAVQFE